MRPTKHTAFFVRCEARDVARPGHQENHLVRLTISMPDEARLDHEERAERLIVIEHTASMASCLRVADPRISRTFRVGADRQVWLGATRLDCPCTPGPSAGIRRSCRRGRSTRPGSQARAGLLHGEGRQAQGVAERHDRVPLIQSDRDDRRFPVCADSETLRSQMSPALNTTRISARDSCSLRSSRRSADLGEDGDPERARRSIVVCSGALRVARDEGPG